MGWHRIEAEVLRQEIPTLFTRETVRVVLVEREDDGGPPDVSWCVMHDDGTSGREYIVAEYFDGALAPLRHVPGHRPAVVRGYPSAEAAAFAEAWAISASIARVEEEAAAAEAERKAT